MSAIMKYLLICILALIFFSCQEPQPKGNIVQDLGQKTEVNNNSNSVSVTEIPKASESKTKENILVLKKMLYDEVEILVPQNFRLMNAEELSLKYENKADKSTEAYANTDGTINIAFQHKQNPCTLEQLPLLKEQLTGEFKNTPRIKEVKKSEIQKINGRDFVIIEFISEAMDTKVYNLMFITSLDNRILLASFNCTVTQMPEWKQIGEQIVKSVKIL